MSIYYKIAALSIFSKICQDAFHAFQLCKHQAFVFINVRNMRERQQCSEKLPRHCQQFHCSNFKIRVKVPRSKMANTSAEQKKKALIKEIFQEEFKKRVDTITNLISSNFKLTMQINYLRKSLKFIEGNLREKFDNVKKRMENQKVISKKYMNIKQTFRIN